jgi:hypothetical protein
MQSLDNIFKAEPKSINDILCKDRTQGFYMPAYQRPYSWNTENIKTLVDDVCSVFLNLLKSTDAIIFLGTLLTVDDDDGKSIYDKEDSQLPQRIKLIVDGQQRTTTLILLLTVLHESLKKDYRALEKDIEKCDDDSLNSDFNTLNRLILGFINQTGGYAIESSMGTDDYKFLPKIIRSMHGFDQENGGLKYDRWGDSQDVARYQSPLSQYLFLYQTNLNSQIGNKVFKELDLDLLIGTENKLIKQNVKAMRKIFKSAPQLVIGTKTDDSTNEKIDFCEFGNENLHECIDFKISKVLAGNDLLSIKSKNLINTAAFSSFLLNRICVTFVTVNSESYAFDMFEALNTTGEPLTAYETFVPRVIEHLQEKTETDARSEHKKLNSISSRFEQLVSNIEKNSLTKQIIIAFKRAYDGVIPTSHIRNQRDSLLDSYGSIHAFDKDRYLSYFKSTSDFMFDVWNGRNVEGLVSSDDQDITKLCLSYLTEINHSIAISLLVQFKIVEETTIEPEHKIQFVQAIKAISAYSLLWRAMSGGADGIDAKYKILHSKSVDINGEIIEPFHLQNAGEFKINIKNLKLYLKHTLFQQISEKWPSNLEEKDAWIEVSKNVPILDKKVENSKMLILAASHGISVSAGVYRRNDDVENNFLTTDMWDALKSNKSSISKIYSQKKNVAGMWNTSLDEYNQEHLIGNCLIDVNNDLNQSNKSTWLNLRSKFKELLEDQSAITLGTNSAISIEGGIKLSSIKFINKYQEIAYIEEWNKEHLEERSVRLLGNAWDNLITWLD